MKNLILFTVSMFLLILNSCQEEEKNEVFNPGTLTKVSTLSGLISRVTQNPTFYDNILDNTSGFSVVLPVTITLNGQTLTVSQNEDYNTVKTIKNQSQSDDDIVHFSFPITIKYKNYQEVIVANQSQLNAIYDVSGPETGFNEIKCIDFNYPLKINYYNTTTQVANTITIADHTQLYNFIDVLKTEEIYNIVYPIAMTKSDSSMVVFNSNDQLQNGIEIVINDCDEPNTNNPELSTIIIDGSWYVSNYIDDNENKTYEYYGYTFTFAANGTTVATKNGVLTNGTWSSYVNNGASILDINYVGSTLDHIDENWTVIEYSTTQIKLRHQDSGSNDDIHYLTFTKN